MSIFDLSLNHCTISLMLMDLLYLKFKKATAEKSLMSNPMKKANIYSNKVLPVHFLMVRFIKTKRKKQIHLIFVHNRRFIGL